MAPKMAVSSPALNEQLKGLISPEKYVPSPFSIIHKYSIEGVLSQISKSLTFLLVGLIRYQ